MLLKGMARSLELVRSYSPQLVFCTGGYVSGPVGLSARALGVPLVLHEQNDYPGVTIRALSRLAAQVFMAFSGAGRRIGGRRRCVVGNPTRGGWAEMDRAEARRQFGLSGERPTLVVVGGSQGARGINGAVETALPDLMARGFQVLWQTGRLDHAAAAAAASRWPDRVVALEFIDDMNAAYRAADLALTRSGAMTLAELTLMGVPAVLVPLPTATEGHQEHNARAMARAGAGCMIRQRDLDGASLARTVSELTADPERLAGMAARSRALAVPDAADRIVDEMERAGLLRR
jgi:UDP-N-acetylglucosamine--N-acetylmuramyl-(pentapeptide) pyrophosphoryl-undecaprenol N-acetylglucosamine transferase